VPQSETVGHSHDLCVQEGVLGSTETRWTRIAGVSFGAAGVSDVAPDELSVLARRVDLLDWAYADVHFPFDLEDLPRHQFYETATVRATFGHDHVTVIHLEPATDSAPPGSLVAAFGYGRPVARWKLATEGGAPLEPRGRGVRVVLRRPVTLTEVDVELEAEVVHVRTIVGRVNRRSATMTTPARYVLSFTDGSFRPVDAA
jgi:hypothetical protein